MPDQTEELISYIRFWAPDIPEGHVRSVVMLIGKWLEIEESHAGT